MRIVVAFILAIAALVAISCGGRQPSPTLGPTSTPTPTSTQAPTPLPTVTPTPLPTPTPTPVPSATPDVPATVQAGIEATKTAEAALEATVEARIAATQAAVPPTSTPPPTPISEEEKLAGEFFDCLESNLAVAGAFTSSYDGPFSGQVQTVLDAAGDITSYLDDRGAFRSAIFVAMNSNPAVGPALLVINLACSRIGSDDSSDMPSPAETPTPLPTEEPEGSKCEELAMRIIERSKEEDHPISEITGIEEISSNLIGLQCKGLSFTRSGEAGWIKLHQNRLGRYGYETLEPSEYECEYLVPRILQLSQDDEQEILEVSDIQELQKNDDELICRGTAKPPGQERTIEFYLKASGAGQQSFGYDFVDGR